MRNDWKYIVFKGGTPIIFPPWIEHKEIADRLAGSSLGKPVSAGLVRISEQVINSVSVQVFGESLTLGLRTAVGDKVLIEKLVEQY